MSKQRSRGWYRSMFTRRPIRGSRPGNPLPHTRLEVQAFEEKALPSITVPLNGFTWTPLGPSPIAQGQEPGGQPSSGRIDGIAVDPVAGAGGKDIIYVASDSGGLWRTTDDGSTWSPRTDQQQQYFKAVRVVHRAGGNTVYGFDQLGDFYLSTDGGTTLKETPVGSPGYLPVVLPSQAGTVLSNNLPVVNNFVVSVVDPNDQTQDILYAAVGSIFGEPPSSGSGGAPDSGIWRSTDGGATWQNIVDPGVSPFTVNPSTPVGTDSLAFSDVAVDPTNPDVVYAAIGNSTFGDPTNGIYRTANARSATPTWQLLFGGSQFVPGEIPGNTRIAVSPSQPSVIFASVALREDRPTGAAPLEGIFRSNDAGANWSPVLIANPNNPVADPNNYMGITGDDNNVIVIPPGGSTDPSQQVVYVAGNGGANAVMVSTDSGATWQKIGIGANGAGTYPNVHDASFDSQNRLILATGGGVFRLNTVYTAGSTAAPVWQGLNGDVGTAGLSTVQFDGFALSPTDPNKALGNTSWFGNLDGVGLTETENLIHNAELFSDSPGAGSSVYGWQTVDAPNGIDNNPGTGQVIFDPFNPNTVYRVSDGAAGRTGFIRRSDDGGLTWTGVAGNGFEAYPYGGGFQVPAFAMDPSSPNRLFSGYKKINVSDTRGDAWSTSMQVSVNGGSTAIPDLPTTQVDNNHGGPITVNAIAVGRESGVDALGTAINGVNIFASVETDAARNAAGDPQNALGVDPNTGQIAGPQIYVNLIPTNSFPWPPPMTGWDNHSWANITPIDPSTGQSAFQFGDKINQIVVDPTNNSTIFVTGQHFTTDPVTGLFIQTTEVYEATNFSLQFSEDANNHIVWVPGPGLTWTKLTANLPTTPLDALPVQNPQNLAYDAQDQILYAGTGNGVWSLKDFSGGGTWQQVGIDPNTGQPTLPPAVPVSALSLNTSTGILAAATYGRGAFEIQIRGLISGHVFTDTNGNGVFDAGEPAFSGVTVEVLDQNAGGAIIASTTTDANGFYNFRSLHAGNYKVVALTNQPGAFQTTGQPANLSAFTEQTTDTVDFGFFQPGSIGGVKFLDLNGDTVRETGEPGLSGFTIYIDQNNDGKFETGEPFAVTKSDGSFSFTNLGPAVLNGTANPTGGTFRLREIQQPGYVATVPAAGSALTFTLTSGQAVTDANFGNRHPTGGGGGTPPTPILVAGEGEGGPPLVNVRNLVTGQTLSFFAYNPGFTGGVRLATGFIKSTTSIPDIIAVPGPGGGPHVRVINGSTGQVEAEFYAYNPAFTGGLYVAVGDVNADGVPDIITGADAGGGPHVKVFDGAALRAGVVKVDESFFAYNIGFTGGVRVASADVNRDGYDDIVTGAGPGGGPQVQVFSGKVISGAAAGPAVVRSFFAYDSRYTGGIYVAAADTNGDGFGDIITGPGLGGGPHLRIFDGASSGTLLAQGFAFPVNSGGGQLGSDTNWTSGLRVATTDFNRDGHPDIIVGPGPGQGPKVRLLDGRTLAVLLPTTNVFDPTFLGGIYVAGD
jgi:hypothetical protein